MTADSPQEELRKLVELFQTNIAQYKSPNYDEANTRTDFIDKFFELLGWDVRNTAGYSEQYRDVVREDRVEIDNRPKAPDYSFRIGGNRKFFVEAKKPSVNIKDDISPAFQIRRYGYTAKLALSILTDFEEFAVYDTRIKPHKNDKASTARIFYCKFDQYLEGASLEGFETNFDYIIGTFSKENILKGSFDRYIEATKNKRGTSEVDKELLALVEEWRLTLAKSMAKQNPELDTYHLNTAVQRIVDRILFLRIAEDRRIERYETLLKTTKGAGVYGRLQSIFADADEKYNAGLFKREDWLGKLIVDDKILAPIISGLYYPESPYEFSVLPIEILGSIYERFLGKTIKLTASHKAEVEEKPEVRKAGGVYYTPQYIVDYIIRETIGRKIDSTKPIPTITTLDPACGSGSFLVGAYTFFLDSYLSHYTGEKNLKKSLKSGVIYESGVNTYRLSIEEKQRILLANIFGVDIDPIAVEVTKLSLYLKLLEHETEESREMLFKHSDLKMLPNLDENIRCGNSLIESDFYRDKDLPLLGDYEMRKVNAFDWKKAFPKIFQMGGFSTVIGNPPYVRIQEMKKSAPDQVEYYKTEYQAAAEGNYDLYTLFLEKGLSLLNPQGRLGMICPNKFFTAQYGRPIREILASGKHLSHVVNFGHNQVFDNATTYTSLLFLEKKSSEEMRYVKVSDLEGWKAEQDLTLKTRTEKRKSTKKATAMPEGPISETGMIACESITAAEWNFTVGKGAALFEKLSKMPVKLGDVANIFVGLQTSADNVFILDYISETTHSIRLYSKILQEERVFEKALFHPIISGTDVGRYSPLPSRQYILFPYYTQGERVELISFKEIEEKYPRTAAYFQENRKKLSGRENGKFKGKGQTWHGYIYLKNMAKQNHVKLCIPRLVNRLHAAFDGDGSHFLDNVDVGGLTIRPDNISTLSLEYLLALLNSRVLVYFFPFISAPFRGGWLSANRQFIEKLPIVVPSTKQERKIHDRLAELVNQMLAAQVKLREAISDADRKLSEQRISILDNQIDALVYELYGLTDEEIGIVEKQ